MVEEALAEALAEAQGQYWNNAFESIREYPDLDLVPVPTVVYHEDS